MISKETKLLLLIGTIVVNLSYAMTSPMIHVYFVKLINSNILATANILTTSLAAIVNATIQSNKIKDFYRHHFLCIIIIDVICFGLISFESIQIPELRFLGLAVLNAISNTLWFTIISDAINHRIEGDDLTKWNSLQKTVNLTASLIGGLLAITLSDLNIEFCILIQCIANLFIGIMDWTAYKRIRY